MRQRVLPLVLCLVCSLALVASGCGSSKSSSPSAAKPKSHHRVAKAAAVGAGAVAVHHAVKKHQAKKLQPGEFCSPKKEHTYAKAHFKCVNGHLQKA